jgi:signal transduction histidine kinase
MWLLDIIEGQPTDHSLFNAATNLVWMETKKRKFRIHSLRARLMMLAMLVYAAMFVIIFYGFSRFYGVVWVNSLAGASPVVVAQIREGAQSTVLMIFGLLLPFWVVGSLFITQQFSKPIAEISASAQQGETDDRGEEVDLEEVTSVFSSTDEIVQLKGMVSSMMTTIRASDEQFRSIVSNQRELIFRWKPDYGLTFVNQAFCDFFDRNEAFLLQTDGDFLRNDMLNLYPELARIIDNEILGKLEPESEIVNETFLNMPNGETHWVQWRTMGLYDRAGQIRELQTIGNILTDLKRAQLRLEEANYQLAMLTQELIKSQEEERINVARYLHDQVLGELGEMARDSKHSLDQETMNQVIDKLRTTIYMMRSPMLNYGLSMALEDLADHLRDQASQIDKMKFVYEVPKSLARFDRQVETQIYRIVQEASKNAFEHAKANKITISGEIKDDLIELVIADNGKGFNLSRNKDGALVSSRHYGMVGMEERCKIIGAQFNIQTELGSGTAVQVRWTPDMIPASNQNGITHPIKLPEV